MAARLLKTFLDITTRCANELKIQTSNAEDMNRLRTLVQETYLDQIIPAGQWKWLRDFIDGSIPATFRTGTATFTQGSPEVTLTDAPPNSVADYWISVSGSNVRYRIRDHWAGFPLRLTLEAPFAETSNTAASFDIWTDRFTLPVDWRETIQVLNDQSPIPLTALGMQKFRELELVSPKTTGRPHAYSTGDFVDPAPYEDISGLPALSTCASQGNIRTLVFSSTITSYFIQGQRIQITEADAYQFNCRAVISSVNANTITYTASQRYNQTYTADTNLNAQTMSNESADERYREMYLYPSLNTFATNLHLLGIKEAAPLIEDTDEPLMPISDRNALVYGTLAIAWASIGRNPQEASRNQALFDRKLSKMLAEIDDSTDLPQLVVSPQYLNMKRMPMRYRRKFLITSGN